MTIWKGTGLRRSGSRKPRVLIFHPALAPYRIDLFNALAERLLLRVVFLHKNVPYQSYDQSRLLAALRAEYAYLQKGFQILGRDIRTGLAHEIATFDPHLIVTHEYSPVTLGVILRRVVNPLPHIVWTADNPNVIGTESVLRRFARRIALPRVDGLIVYSEETKTYYKQSFRFRGPVGICPNAQAEDALRRKLHDALTVSKSLASRNDLAGKKVVLYVGRLATVKRLDRLVEAFAAVCGERQDIVLVLVGDGPERSALEEQARTLGVGSKVLFAGHCEGQQLYAWFNLGSVFALTSDFEPWGAVVNEALVAGIPVICSDQAGARVLVFNAKNGDVVDANSASILAMRLDQWLSRVAPTKSDQLNALRPSLMTQSFREAVEGFLSPIYQLLRCQAALQEF